ncbi:MAG: response regulator transcription factor [Bryobacter sp.]|nr:response regulator transcription factor [Bryobacter sp.]
MIRLFLVEDEALVRIGLRELLTLEPDFQVAGDAASGAEAIERIPAATPDVILMDVRMPGLSGPQTIQALRAQGCGIPVILITTFDHEESLIAGLRAGAQGYLRKDVSLDQLKSAIQEVLAGKTVLRPAITENLQSRLRREGAQFESSEMPDPLTGREVEVLRLMAAGFSNREVAELLGNTEGTIKSHASSILSKLGVRDRTRAVLKALELGII